jgi:hypothetical protein
MIKAGQVVFVIFLMSLIASCNPLGKENAKVTFFNPGSFQDLKLAVNSVSVQNNQLIITGSKLSTIKTATLKNNSQTETFEVESASDSQLITNGVKNISLLAGSVFDLVLSDAYGSATFQVAFTLADGSVTATKLNSMGATAGQVLKYNGTTWGPASLPNSQIFLGTWNATANNPDISTLGQFQNGDYYIVSTAGIFNSITYNIGDWAIFNGTAWEKINNSSNVVSSFNGRRGVVVPLAGDYTWAQITKTASKLEDIADINVTSRNDGDVLLWDASTSKWISSSFSSTPPSGSVGTSQIANTSVTYGKLNLNDGDIPQAKVNGLVTALSGKEPTIAAGITAQYYRGDKSWQTLDTSAVSENTNLYFTNARVLGLTLTGIDTTLAGTINAADTVLSAFGKSQKQISILSSASGSYLVKNNTDTVTGQVTVDGTTGSLLLPRTPSDAELTEAANVNYVKTYADTKLPLIGGTVTGDVSFDTQLKLKNGGAATYITVKAPTAGTTAYTISLPLTAGSANQVLATDGTGVTSWTTPPTTATPSGTAGGDLAGSYPNPTLKTALITDSHIATTLSESKITNLVTDLASKASSTLTSANIFVGNGSNVATGMALSGDAAISNAGVLTLNTVTVAKGGTGLTAGTSGGIPYFNASSTMDSSGVMAANGVVLGGGAGATPTTTSAGSADQVFRIPAAGGAPAFGAIDLTKSAAVTGALTVANGGTGNNTLGLNQLLFGNGTSAIGGLATTATPSVLLSTNVTGAPAWTTSTTGNYLKATTGSGVSFGPILSSDLPAGSLSGSGTANYVPYYSASTTLANSPIAILGSYVGIGTTSPAASLHVNKTACTGTISSTGTAVAGAGTNFTTAFSVGDQLVANSQSKTITAIADATNLTVNSGFSADLVASTSYARIGAIFNAGNVGIGTTVPNAKFEVVEDSNINYERGIVSSQYNNGVQASLFIGKKARGSFTTPAPIQSGDYITGLQGIGYMSTGAFSNTHSAMLMKATEAWSPTAEGFDLHFYTGITGALTQTENMTLASNGYVGIGTTTPDNKFDVSASASGAVGGIAQITNPATSAVGNAVELRMAPSSSHTIRYASIQGINFDGSNNIDLAFLTGSGASITEKMRIKGSGNVGIGTTAPGATLHIAGASGTTLKIVDTNQALGKVLTSDANGVATWQTPATSGTITSVTGTAPVVSSGGNTPAISMAAATTSVNGYLTSTDWTTFNNKAATASPTFTGVPLAPTASVSTNTTQIATTAFVLGQVGTATPLINGTAAVGTSLLYARQDHVHPVDTSRAPAAGSASITTLGTITTGTWNGTTIAVANGGTGNTTIASNQLLYGSATGVMSGLTAPATATSGVLLSAITTGLPTWTTSTTGNVLQGSLNGVVFGPITNITPGADFTLTQNSVIPFTSVNTGAVVNTLYLKTGNVGIGTTAPGSTLDVNGVITKNGGISKVISYSVPTATNITINLPTGGTNLVDGYIYKFNLGTQATGTVTGAKYIVYQIAIGTWASKIVSSNGSLSNNPSLQISGTNVQIFHNHPSTYNIGVLSEAVLTGNINVISPNYFGLDGAMTNIAGNVGIGTTTPSQKLDVSGIVRAGSVSAVLGSTMLVDAYTNGSLTNFGTEYSTGAPMIGYTVTADTASQASFLSSTPIAATRAAIEVGGSTGIRFYEGASQTVAIGSAVTMSEVMRITNAGNLGIGTTSPTNLVSLGGNAARSVWMERHTTTNTAGNNLTLQAGGATSAATDKSGGGLILSGGTATGTGTSTISFQTATAQGSTNTTDNAPATKMTILGSGNVGIGTTTPSNLLQISTSVAGQGITIDSGGVSLGSLTRGTVGSTVGLAIEGVTGRQISINGSVSSNVLLANGGGNVGIGTTAPATLFETQVPNASGAATVAGTFSMASFTGTANNEVKVLLGPTNLPGDSAGISASRRVGGSTGFSIYTGNAGATLEAVHIKGNGNVGIGTTTPATLLHVSTASVGATVATFQSGTGSCTVIPNAGMSCSSDIRLKENIVEIMNGLDKVLNLRGVTFQWKERATTDNSRYIGFIAQEVEKVAPELVKEDTRGYKQVNYANFVAVLTEAVKEFYHRWFDDSQAIHHAIASIEDKSIKLEAENAQIKAKAFKVEAENVQLKARLDKIEKILEKIK